MCLNIARISDTVVTVHGEHTEADGEGVFMGGINTELGDVLTEKLRENGFIVKKHPNRKLQGLEVRNICNRGKLRRGVQFELSRTVREEMFSSLSSEGRKVTTAKFNAFVETVRRVLTDAGGGFDSAAHGTGPHAGE